MEAGAGTNGCVRLDCTVLYGLMQLPLLWCYFTINPRTAPHGDSGRRGNYLVSIVMNK